MVKYEFVRKLHAYEQIGKIYPTTCQSASESPDEIYVTSTDCEVLGLNIEQFKIFIQNVIMSSQYRFDIFEKCFRIVDNKLIANLVISYSKRIKMKRNQIIFHAGDPFESVYVVLKGEIELIQYKDEEVSEDDELVPFRLKDLAKMERKNLQSKEESVCKREVEIMRCPPGTIVGVEALVRTKPRPKAYLCTARVLTQDTIVYRLELNKFMRLEIALEKSRWNPLQIRWRKLIDWVTERIPKAKATSRTKTLSTELASKISKTEPQDPQMASPTSPVPFELERVIVNKKLYWIDKPKASDIIQ